MANNENASKPRPQVWWVVVDEAGLPEFITIDCQMAQDHINDALQEHGCIEAAKWIVRPVAIVSDCPETGAHCSSDECAEACQVWRDKPEPQAQAGEPESLAARLRNTPNWMRESYGSWKDCTLVYDRAPFEAADALEESKRLHKEVLADLDIRINWLEQTIAKKDAALKACVEALEESKRWHNGDKWRTHGNEEQIAAWKAHRDAISAAITQGQEAQR